MAWKKVSPEMSELLAKALAGFEVEERRMFGCPAWYAGENWMGGVHQNDILIRLSAVDRAELVREWPTAKNFAPFPNRKMKEFMVLPPRLLQDADQLDGWLRRSRAYAAALPPKKKKAKKK